MLTITYICKFTILVSKKSFAWQNSQSTFVQDCLVLPVSYLSVSFEWIGCEPVLNLSATPDEAVSI
jgi:hypothetical protein